MQNLLKKQLQNRNTNPSEKQWFFQFQNQIWTHSQNIYDVGQRLEKITQCQINHITNDKQDFNTSRLWRYYRPGVRASRHGIGIDPSITTSFCENVRWQDEAKWPFIPGFAILESYLASRWKRWEKSVAFDFFSNENMFGDDVTLH